MVYMSLPKKITKKSENKTPAIETTLPSELVVTPENQESIIATCDKVALTREKCITAILEGLSATKIILDKHGEEHTEPDHDKRLKAAMAGLELRGDFRNKAVTIDSSRHTHVIYEWKNNNIFPIMPQNNGVSGNTTRME